MAVVTSKVKVLVVAAGILIALAAWAWSVLKPKSHALVPASSACFTVSTPINYRVVIPNHGLSCSLSGQAPNGESVLITPQVYSSLDDGISKLQKSRSGLNGVKTTLGGLPAYQINGTSKDKGGGKFTSRIYVVYVAKGYKRRLSPADTVNGFLVTINVKSSNQKLLDQIATSLRWR